MLWRGCEFSSVSPRIQKTSFTSTAANCSGDRRILYPQILLYWHPAADVFFRTFEPEFYVIEAQGCSSLKSHRHLSAHNCAATRSAFQNLFSTASPTSPQRQVLSLRSRLSRPK